MKMRTLLCLSFVAAGIAANAQYNDLDLVSGATAANTLSEANFGVHQIFGDAGLETLSSFGVEEFKASFSNVDRAAAIVEVNSSSINEAMLESLDWKLSIYKSLADAGADNGISQTVKVDAASATTGSTVGAFTATWSGNWAAGLTAGSSYYMTLVPYLNFGSGNQTFLMNRANGTPNFGTTLNNGMVANPGQGWGSGSTIDISPSNVALAINTVVPEPTTMIALGAGLVALARRRRSK